MTSSCTPRNGPETRTMALSQPARLFLLPPRGQSSVGSTGQMPKDARVLAWPGPRLRILVSWEIPGFVPSAAAGWSGETLCSEVCTWRAQL